MPEYKLPTEEALAQNLAAGLVAHSLFILDKHTPSDDGTDYKSLYYGMVNGVTDILRSQYNNVEDMSAALKQLHCDMEDRFIEA